MGTLSMKEFSVDIDDLHYEELNGNSYFDFYCKKGHRNIIVLQEQPFELLFQSGVVLLSKRYTREAVLNFASSLERYMEFCIKALVFSEQCQTDSFVSTWEGIGNRTERQLGAFYFLYLMAMKEAPELINKKKIGKKDMDNFRNDIIHNGHFVSNKEAETYGKYVYDFIISTLTLFNEKLGDKWQTGLNTAVFHHLNATYECLNKSLGKSFNDYLIQQVSMPT